MTALGFPEAAGLARLRNIRIQIRPGIAISSVIVLLLVVALIAPGLLTTRSPTAIDLEHTLLPPSLSHPFGTDDAGRDLYTRVVYGARESLSIGLGATGLAMGTAIVLGFLGGLAGDIVDIVIARILEIAFAFPVLLLALLLITIYGPSLQTEIIAVGIGQSIVWASGLAFLGLGVAPPSPEWGALLDSGRLYITTSWWLEILPGAVIVLVALSVTTLGRALQHQLEGAAR